MFGINNYLEGTEHLAITWMISFCETVESACSVVVTWEAIHPKSGLDVTYLLYQGKEINARVHVGS